MEDIMLKIGDFSKLTRISIRMLRHYNDIGLLIPHTIDKFTEYRYYSETQLPLANRISALKEMGFSLAKITEILRECVDSDTLKKHLLLKHTELTEQSERMSEQLVMLESSINRLESGKEYNYMNYAVILKELPERNVASVRQIIPTYYQEGTLWGILMSETAPLKMQTADPCYALAVFHDGEYKENDVDVEVQISVNGSYTNTENVVFKTVPAVQIASATYKGGYEQSGAVNEAVANWINDNNYEINGMSFFIYHVSPHETNNPDEYITEVCYPVNKKA